MIKFYRTLAPDTLLDRIFVPSSGENTFFARNEGTLDSKLTLFFTGRDASNIEMSVDGADFKPATVPFEDFVSPGETLQFDIKTKVEQSAFSSDVGLLRSEFEIQLLFSDRMDFIRPEGDQRGAQNMDFIKPSIIEEVFAERLDFKIVNAILAFEEKTDFIRRGTESFRDRTDFSRRGVESFRDRTDFLVRGSIVGADPVDFGDSGLGIGDDPLNDIPFDAQAADENFDFEIPFLSNFEDRNFFEYDQVDQTFPNGWDRIGSEYVFLGNTDPSGKRVGILGWTMSMDSPATFHNVRARVDFILESVVPPPTPPLGAADEQVALFLRTAKRTGITTSYLYAVSRVTPDSTTYTSMGPYDNDNLNPDSLGPAGALFVPPGQASGISLIQADTEHRLIASARDIIDIGVYSSTLLTYELYQGPGTTLLKSMTVQDPNPLTGGGVAALGTNAADVAFYPGKARFNDFLVEFINPFVWNGSPPSIQEDIEDFPPDLTFTISVSETIETGWVPELIFTMQQTENFDSFETGLFASTATQNSEDFETFSLTWNNPVTMNSENFENAASPPGAGQWPLDPSTEAF